MKLLINYYNMKLQYHIFVQKKEKKRKEKLMPSHFTCAHLCALDSAHVKCDI